jgi:hypothetical protein
MNRTMSCPGASTTRSCLGHAAALPIGIAACMLHCSVNDGEKYDVSEYVHRRGPVHGESESDLGCQSMVAETRFKLIQ